MGEQTVVGTAIHIGCGVYECNHNFEGDPLIVFEVVPEIARTKIPEGWVILEKRVIRYRRNFDNDFSISRSVLCPDHAERKP